MVHELRIDIIPSILHATVFSDNIASQRSQYRHLTGNVDLLVAHRC